MNVTENPILVVKKLKDLLGTESSDNWINFMDYIHQELSLILKIGKPRAVDIENSFIGQVGFKSWREMIDAREDEGGLAWNHASFDAWKRAYSVVLKHSYLRELELTASQINTMQRESKPDFPTSLSEFKAFSDNRKEKQVEQHQNSLKDAQNRSAELQVANKKLNEEVARLFSVAKQLAEKEKEVIKLQTKLDDRVSELAILNEKVDELTKSNIELEFKIENPVLKSRLKRFFSLFK